MDGTAVFNFVQVEVPPMIQALLTTAQISEEEVDYFLFHQPNRFMLEKLADRLKIPYEKMPSNVVEHYGNSSSVTIPMAAVHNLRERLLAGSIRTCLAGFGVGLTWASMLLKLGPLRFCELVEFPKGMENAGHRNHQRWEIRPRDMFLRRALHLSRSGLAVERLS